MKNYVQRGDTLTIVAPYALFSGNGCRVGNLFGVASYDALIGASAEIVTQGVFDLTKDGSTFATGDLVYWDDVAKKATSTVGANLLIGQATLDQASGTAAPGGLTGDATVRVRLFGEPGFSGQASGLKVAHALYDYTVDGGASCTPANSDTIPANAVVYGGMVNSIVALGSGGGSATLAIGTTAGSAANSILTATAQATLSANATVKPTCATTPFKMSAAGQISVAVAAGPLNAGKVEVWVFYQTAAA